MNIYVGNLSFEFSSEELRELFEEHGEVSSAMVIMDKISGRSRGFGFVEMPRQAEAQVAIQELNGKMIQGRELRVNEARPREDRPRSFGGGDRDRGSSRGGPRSGNSGRRNY